MVDKSNREIKADGETKNKIQNKPKRIGSADVMKMGEHDH